MTVASKLFILLMLFVRPGLCLITGETQKIRISCKSSFISAF